MPDVAKIMFHKAATSRIGGWYDNRGKLGSEASIDPTLIQPIGGSPGATNEIRDWANIRKPITPMEWTEADDILAGIVPKTKSVETVAAKTVGGKLTNRGASWLVNNRGRLIIGGTIAASMAATGWLAFGKRKDRQTQITGLSDAGIAKHSRHAMTSFGTGWTGEKEPKVWRDVPGEKYPITFSVGEYGEILPESGGRHRLIQAIKKGYERVEVNVNRGQGFVKTTVNARFLAKQMGVTEESLLATDLQQAYRAGGGMPRKPVIESAEKLVKTVMKSGEGSAIAKVGSAEVPAVIRAAGSLMRSL